MTVIGATNVVHFCTAVKVCRERPVCRSVDVAIITRVDERYYLTAACRGGNLPPATFRIQPVWLNGTTQCTGDDSSPSHVSNTTRVGERYYLTAACRGGAPRSESKSTDCRWQSHHNFIGNLPPATFRIQPVWLNGITYRYVIPTEMKWSGGIFPSCENNQHKVKLATWEDSSTRFAPSE